MAHKRGNKWVARGYNPATRRSRYLGTRDTKREARQLEADWQLKHRALGDETCSEFAERWLRDYPRPRESTRMLHTERLRSFVHEFGHLKLGQIEPARARAWALGNRASHATARAMLADAVRDGLVDRNPFAQLRVPHSRGRAQLVALTERQLCELADTALHPSMELGPLAREFRAMILFAGYVGLRPGELFALERTALVGQMLTIERAFDSKSRTIGPTKTGRARVVTVPRPALQALLDVPAHPSGLMFESPRGRMWSRSSHHYYWRQLRVLAGHPGLDHYELRHCAATMLLERGVSPWDVAIQLGHTDGGQLVMHTYGHPREDAARRRLIAAYETEIQPLRVVDGNAG